MSTSAKNKQMIGLIESVKTTDSKLIINLEDGRSISVPLQWYPRLKKASATQRAKYKLISNRQAIHWPLVDEDLELEGIINGIPSPEYRRKKKTK